MIDNETIVAQATPPGRGGIGILRVSGLKARNVAEIILGKLPKPRYAEYLLFKDTNDFPLDKGIALWFPRPNSFTGEDVLELHGHGGPVVLDLLLRYISSIPGIRIAGPGEFSERAFLNDKLDLTQAEAISDLINANSEQAVRSALNSFQGTFSVCIKNIIEKIIRLRTFLEAAIDFPDEEIDFSLYGKIELHLDEAIDYLDIIYNQAQQGSFLREEIRVVIAGFPNVGKSSLLNVLTGQESAIITDIAGTTRDVLHEHIYIDGLPIHIIDTAGLHSVKEDEVERIGIARAWQEIKKANHILFVVDSTVTSETNLEAIWPDYSTAHPLQREQSVTLIRNKIDITGEKSGIKVINNGYSVIFLSARTGDGVDVLRNFLKKNIGFNSKTEVKFLARQRHFEALIETMNHLKQGKLHLMSGNSWASSDLLAEELRLAHSSLSRIIGNQSTSDDLLDEIFSNFCIGK